MIVNNEINVNINGFIRKNKRIYMTLYREGSYEKWWYMMIKIITFINFAYIVFLLLYQFIICTLLDIGYEMYFNIIPWTIILLFLYIEMLTILFFAICFSGIKYEITVLLIISIILSAFFANKSETQIVSYLPGSWGMVQRTSVLSCKGINIIIAVGLDIIIIILSIILGKKAMIKNM